MKKLFALMVAFVATSFGAYATINENPKLDMEGSNILVTHTESVTGVKTWLEEIDMLKTPAEQELINLSRNKWKWMSEKDVDKLAELFHDEAQFVHMGGYWGKEQELGIIRSGGIWYKEAEIHSEEVKFTENTAVVYSRIHLNAVVGGNEVRNPFIVSEVYVKEDGKWLLSVLAFTKTMGK